MASQIFKELPSVSELIRLYKLTAKKQMSQNFLLEANLADKFARSAGPLENSHVIEVGAGPGTLTRAILNAGAKKVTAIEKDHRFLPALQLLADAAGPRMQILHADALEVNYTELFDKELHDTSSIKIIGNLPFNVATPLYIKYLKLIADDRATFKYPISLTLAFQKEVAERIVALPNSAARSRLSVLTQSLCTASLSFVIPGKMFVPPPKVDAAVVSVAPLKNIDRTPGNALVD